KFSAMLGFLAQMATMIARSGLANLRLQECAGNEKNLLYSVIDSIPDSIFIKDCESVYLDCNKAFKTFFGLTAKKISGQTDFDFFPEESARLFQEKDRTMLASGRPQRNQEWVKCEDDGERLFDTLKVPYRDGQGHLLGVIGISRDITELKKIEAENIALQAKLLEARKLEMVKTLAGGIAHDFNNALTSVIGNIELLKMNPSARNLRDCTKAVEESAYRMADLTKKLLAYARGGKYQERKLKLQDFLEKAVPKTGFRSNEKIAIELDLDCREAAIMADPEQLQMIINALIGNAVEAISEYGRIVLTCKTPNFTEAFKLQHEAVASGAYICFSVKDDGCGMSRECRERIFEPFFSTKFTGRGLSMAATYGIVKNHGGYINVNSTPGQGTEVEVYWPLLPPEPAQTAAIPAAPEKFTILVIEDDEMLLNLENKFLERLGYKVVLTAGNGREALRQVKEYDGGIDICLMDVRLPDMPAEFLYRQLTNIRPDLKVLLCSASALDWEAQKAIQAGAQGFLEKPFSLTQLQESLAKLTY
ncbi:MAG: PAS domain-containing protein, partial [Deltaproteobacteria bacterium]|nr:PAS domain-containing protein [Deltaproteobacteria bacterium]